MIIYHDNISWYIVENIFQSGGDGGVGWYESILSPVPLKSEARVKYWPVVIFILKADFESLLQREEKKKFLGANLPPKERQTI